jgi:PAS domain S-box-containing protein
MLEQIFTVPNTKKLLDSLYNLIVITDGKLEGPDHPKILYVNRAFEALTGYGAEEIIGQTPRILQGDKTDRGVLDRLKETLLRGEFFEGSAINYTKEGKEYWVEWNITPIANDQGEVINYFCVQKDITEHVRHEELLQQRVEEEINKRKHQELINQKQAKMAAMGEMIDAIAHQWKQPIGNIKLRTEMLGYDIEDGEDPKEAVAAFKEKVDAQIVHMENTLHEFRSFLRTDKTLSLFYIKNTVETVLLLLKDEFIKHNICVTVEIDPAQYFYGHPNEFKHVILNILGNAKDAFAENNIATKRMHITGYIEDKDNVLTIQDNAGGINEDSLPRLFEPEFTTKSADKGSGIGLYMTKQILDKFHAAIQAYNCEDGAVFEIRWTSP